MRQISEDTSLIRQYLLGELPEAEQQQVEEQFMLDAQYRENVLIIEEELIEDYLDGALTEQERDKFTTHFLATPQQQQKLRIAKSLKKYVEVGADVSPPSESEETASRNNGLRKSSSWRNPLMLLPIAAAIIVALTFGVMKLSEMRRMSEQREQEQSRRTAIERELAQANDAANTRGTQVFPVILPPVSVRGAQSSGRFAPPADRTEVELWLVLSGEKYPAYRVLLQKIGEPAPFTIHNLRAESTPAGQAVAVRIPTHLLTRGDYRLQLLGVAANGETGPVGDYDFQITDRTTP